MKRTTRARALFTFTQSSVSRKSSFSASLCNSVGTDFSELQQPPFSCLTYGICCWRDIRRVRNTLYTLLNCMNKRSPKGEYYHVYVRVSSSKSQRRAATIAPFFRALSGTFSITSLEIRESRATLYRELTRTDPLNFLAELPGNMWRRDAKFRCELAVASHDETDFSVGTFSAIKYINYVYILL